MPETLRDLVNVGPSIERDLRAIGIERPADAAGRDPLELFARLEAVMGSRHDPCVLDTLMSVVEQAEGGPGRPWWTYTEERKRLVATARGRA